MERIEMTTLSYRSLLCFVAVMLWQSVAFAELIRITNIADLMAESPLIAVITVLHVQPLPEAEEEIGHSGRVYMRCNAEVSVLDYLKGTPVGGTITLRHVPCGSDNHSIVSLDGGNTYVVFMRKDNDFISLIDNYNAIYPIKTETVLPAEGDLRTRLRNIFLNNLSSADKYILTHALMGLAHTGDSDNLQEIRRLTTSRDDQVRMAAYVALVHLGDIESAFGLVTHMETMKGGDPSVMLKLRPLISSALASIGPPNQTSNIISLLAVAQTDQAIAPLVSALRDTLSPNQVDALLPYLDHSNAYIAYDAYVAVSKALGMKHSSVMAFRERREELVDEINDHIDAKTRR